MSENIPSPATAIVLDDKKTINGWAFFDWANSAYALVISTAIFPAYFLEYSNDYINILGYEVSNSSFYSFAVAISYFIIALLSPILSGMADYSGKRMWYLKFFTIMGSIACMALFFYQGMATLWIGAVAFILATIGFAGGIVFYNAYLPEIASEAEYDRVSAKGYAYGYVGSVILLLINLVMILKPELFGLPDAQMATRLAFVMVGIWWISFAQISFRRLPKDAPIKNSSKIIQKGFQELKFVWGKVIKQTNVKRFLISFFFYSAGVQTVIYLAGAFASKELGFGMAELIITILIIQFVGIVGAYLFAFISKKIGNKNSIMIMICIWIFICLVAYTVQSKTPFYMIAGLVGLVMGGIQSLSRSTYSKLIQEKSKDLTSYFSFYDVLYKISLVMGTILFGTMDQVTGSMRSSVLALSILFLIGLALMYTVKIKKGSIS